MAKIEYKNIQMRAPTYEKVKRAAEKLGLNLGQTIDWIMENQDKASQFGDRYAEMQRNLAKFQIENIELKGRLDELRRSKMTKKEREDEEYDAEHEKMREEYELTEKLGRKITTEEVRDKAIKLLKDRALLAWEVVPMKKVVEMREQGSIYLKEYAEKFYEHYSNNDPEYSEEMYANTMREKEFSRLSGSYVPRPIPQNHLMRFLVKWAEEELGHPFDTDFCHYEDDPENAPALMSSVFTSSGE